MLGFSHFYRLNTLILGQFPCFSGIFHIKPFDRPIFLNYPENLQGFRPLGLPAAMFALAALGLNLLLLRANGRRTAAAAS